MFSKITTLLKSVYQSSQPVLIVLMVLVGYFAWNCWQDERIANAKVIELSEKIERLNKENDRKEAIIADREKEKSTASLEIKKLQERLKNALKDNQCANEPMPSDIINWMREGKN